MSLMILSNKKVNLKGPFWEKPADDRFAFVFDETNRMLKENFVFNSSLGYNESFHADLIRMLLLQNESCDPLLKRVSDELAAIFLPKDGEKDASPDGYRVISVFRDFHKFDLFIAFLDSKSFDQIKKLEIGKRILDTLRSSSGFLTLKDLVEDGCDASWQTTLKILQKNCRFAVVENKFKTVPDEVRLLEYYSSVNRQIPFIQAARNSVKIHRKNTKFYWLNGNYREREFPNLLPPWKQVFYAQIAKRIEESVENLSDKAVSFTAQYLKNYVEMLRIVLWLSCEVTKSHRLYGSVFPEKIFLDRLSEVQLNEYYEKVWFTKLVYRLEGAIPKAKDIYVIKESGYTNGLGLMGYKCLLRDGSRIAYGVQMQNRQLRIYVEPLPSKYYRIVENDERLREGHLPDYRKKTYRWVQFDESRFYKALDKVRSDVLKKLKKRSFIDDLSQNLFKVGETVYVGVKLSPDTSQWQFFTLLKKLLLILGEMVRENHKLLKVR